MKERILKVLNKRKSTIESYINAEKNCTYGSVQLLMHLNGKVEAINETISFVEGL